jgi:hypothetical protein
MRAPARQIVAVGEEGRERLGRHHGDELSVVSVVD